MLGMGMSKLDVAKEQIAYLKLWLGIVIVTDISVVGWLLGNFRAAEWPLIVGDILAFIGISWGCYALHTGIESAIAKLEDL
jgi:putative Mn2+ efflux pump MntP